MKKKVLPEITWQNIAPPYKDYAYFKEARNYPFRFDSSDFDMLNAWWLSEAATLVYADEIFVREKFLDAGISHTEFFAGNSTKCFIAHNSQFAIVAFRGTEMRLQKGQTDFQDIFAYLKTDFDIWLTPSDQGGRVHSGFRKALDAVWDDLAIRLKSLVENDCSVWMTGHSLGAALATLAAVRFPEVQGLYTFGSPRAGDRVFADNFNVKAYRFVNGNDIVSRVPPAGFYRHVGQLRFIDKHGHIHCAYPEQGNFKEEIIEDVKALLGPAGQLRKGLPGFIPDGLIDHVPTRYATHIWNSISHN